MDIELQLQADAVFGNNFKVRCTKCMATSGWNTITSVNVWWAAHKSFTGHCVAAKFIRKEPI